MSSQGIQVEGRGDPAWPISLVKLLLKLMGSGMLLGLALAGPFLVADAYGHFSAARAFEQVHLGMPRLEAESILLKEGIWCGWPGVSDASDSVCCFSDFWRNYLIVVDPSTGVVSRKYFAFKHRRRLLDRIGDLWD